MVIDTRPAATPTLTAHQDGARRPPGRSDYFSLVNQLRGAAALLVVWDHMVGQWLSQQRLHWEPNDLVERFVMGPLNIIQHGGFLGVALFFLISGFVVTRAATRETPGKFAVRRLLRVYPPMIVAVLLAVGIAWLQHWSGHGSAAWESITPVVVLKAMTMLTYVSVPQVVIVGVAWTLLIELIFYGLVGVGGFVLRRSWPDWIVPAGILVVVGAIQLTATSFGAEYFLFSVSVAYVPLLVLGQLVYLVTQRGARIWLVGLLGVVTWLVFVRGIEPIYPNSLTPEGSYGSSISIALVLFLVAVLAEGRIRANRVLDLVAARSYSLYLVHGIVGLYVMNLVFVDGWTFPWALVAGLLASALGTELVYRGVEKPSIAVGRLLTRQRTRPAGGTAGDPGRPMTVGAVAS
ncbi:acyltransferase family protein [Catellatospora paridis]|uniref:acyltransferase family protein n=1 Tax=Catellatospora paridis TaxID=1617086 RepID=UPI0012D3BD11|nr:acyltransferase [Catellatospora paridis]